MAADPPRDSVDMRRLRALLAAGALAPDDEVAFELKASRYTAKLGADGSLVHRKPHAPATSPTLFEVYESPTEWAHAMTKRHNTKRGARSRSRGKISVNGWEDCRVGGRTLAEIRAEVIRDGKVGKAVREAAAEEEKSAAGSAPAGAAVEADDAGGAGPGGDSGAAGAAAAAEEGAEAVKSAGKGAGILADDAKDDGGKKSGEDAGVKSKEVVEQFETATTERAPTEQDTVDGELEEKKNQSSDRNKDAQSGEKKGGSEDKYGSSGASGQPPVDGDEAAVMTTEEPDRNGSASEASVERSLDDTKGKQNKRDGNDGGGRKEKGKGGEIGAKRDAAEPQDPPIEQREKNGNSKDDFDGTAEERSQPSSIIGEERAPEKDAGVEAAEVTAGVSSPGASSVLMDTGDLSDAPSNSNKRPRSSSPEHGSAKRPRGADASDTGTAPTSGANPPRARARSNRRRRAPSPPLAEYMGLVGDDPAAAEAAAVAAAAEKEEASSRARRTTRLAAGKIKQVDYKPPSALPPQFSAGNEEFDDGGDPANVAPTPRTSARQRNAPARLSRRGTERRRRVGGPGTSGGVDSAEEGGASSHAPSAHGDEVDVEKSADEGDGETSPPDEVATEAGKRKEGGTDASGESGELPGVINDTVGNETVGNDTVGNDTVGNDADRAVKPGPDAENSAVAGGTENGGSSAAEKEDDADDEREDSVNIGKSNPLDAIIAKHVGANGGESRTGADVDDDEGDEDPAVEEGQIKGDDEAVVEASAGVAEEMDEGDGGNSPASRLEDDEAAPDAMDEGGGDDETEELPSGRGGSKGSSLDMSLPSARGVSTRVGTKRRSKTPETPVEESDDGDDLSPELEAADREDDSEPRDEDGWSASDLEAMGSAVKSSASLDPAAVHASASRTHPDFDRSQEDVASYLSSAAAVIREYCPRTPSAASSEAGIRINDMLSYLAAELTRLWSGEVRPAGEVAKQIRREARHRMALDKARRKNKRELEELRTKLETAMEARRRASLEAAYHQLRVGECKRAILRERGKRRRIEAETDLHRQREQDAKDRADKVKQLYVQLRNDQVTGGSEGKATGSGADPGTANGVDAMKVSPKENGTSAEGDGGADTDAAGVDSGTSADMEADKDDDEREVIRLRSLIATYEAEAEAGQRACEVERARANLLADSKAKLEHDMYVQRSGLLDKARANHVVADMRSRALADAERAQKQQEVATAAASAKVGGSSRQKTGGGGSSGSGGRAAARAPAAADKSAAGSRRKGAPIRSLYH